MKPKHTGFQNLYYKMFIKQGELLYEYWKENNKLRKTNILLSPSMCTMWISTYII